MKTHQATGSLSKIFLRRGENTEALQAWERFQNLPFVPANSETFSEGARLEKSSAIPHSPPSLVLVIALVDDSYVGWLIAPEPLRVLRTVALGDGTALRRLATTFYHLCSDRDSSVADIHTVGSRLFSIVFQPFYGELQGAHQLWLELDPSLSGIPFAALSMPTGGWLGDSMQITLLPPWWSAQSELPRTTAESIPSASRMFVVNGFGPVDQSLDAYSEAPAISTLFPHTTILNGQAATPQSVLEEIRFADVVHFSGHAANEGGSQFLLNPSGEGAGASLGAGSFSSLRLRHCKLAVLAACNTAGSDPDRPEPMLDLRKALLRSGADTVIASNWDVDDQSTQALMLAFYRQIVQGVPVSQSLERAQKAVRSDVNWGHPYYWASFQIFAN